MAYSEITDSPASERVLTRIRKLLAVAEHPNTGDAEAETYMAQAMALMAKYGIERALLSDSGDVSDTVGMTEIEITGSYPVEQDILIHNIVIALRCMAVKSRRYDQAAGRRINAIQIVGFESDRERVKLLVASLTIQMFAAMRRSPVPEDIAHVTYRKSFCSGFIGKVSERLEAAERKAAHDAEETPEYIGRSTDLILRDRSTAVATTFAELFPKVKPGRSFSRSDVGIVAGAAAGARADIGGSYIVHDVPDEIG